ncbi:autotransporter outer membrane beta-barrel domain-containing protein [Desulfovibrio sp. OttesenSCG-928-I05]|nr:autotransporter outer membrane beta-barrel domain-containing protein [Desulfovibrio sp. OttesenSCG-928-I05]
MGKATVHCTRSFAVSLALAASIVWGASFVNLGVADAASPIGPINPGDVVVIGGAGGGGGGGAGGATGGAGGEGGDGISSNGNYLPSYPGGSASGPTGGTGGQGIPGFVVGGTSGGSSSVGAGGDGGAGGLDGEAGGAATGYANGSNYERIFVIGGAAGANGQTATSAGGLGGDGGTAKLTLRASSVTAGQGVFVVGGDYPTSGSGSGYGGGAELYGTGTTLYTPFLYLDRPDPDGAAIKVNINTLAVTRAFEAQVGPGYADTTVMLDGLFGGDSVHFNNILIANGSSLAVETDFLDLDFDKLIVDGIGNYFVYANSGMGGPVDLSGKDMSFFLRPNIQDGDALLLAFDLADAGNGDADIDQARIAALHYGGARNFNVGDTVALVAGYDSYIDGTALDEGSTIYSARGDSFYIFQDQEWGDLLATLTGLSPAMKSYAEGRVATHAFVNHGTDLILNKGLGAAMRASENGGLNAFGAVEGGKMRYDTGSHADVEGVNMMAGFAWGNPVGTKNNLTLGAFFEAGWGSYDTENSFARIGNVNGEGDTSYYGGGILARFDHSSGVYGEVSGRAGVVDMEYKTNDIPDTPADFDTDATYYGAHAGLGYKMDLSEKAMLDLSAKVMWTHQASDSLTVGYEHVKFDAADSLRTRLGGRLNYAITSELVPYIGAYWEHEFDGDATSKVNGHSMETPSLDGSSGMGELGFSFRPAGSNLSMDLGVQGYLGTREGVSGGMNIKYEF